MLVLMLSAEPVWLALEVEELLPECGVSVLGAGAGMSGEERVPWSDGNVGGVLPGGVVGDEVCCAPTNAEPARTSVHRNRVDFMGSSWRYPGKCNRCAAPAARTNPLNPPRTKPKKPHGS